MANDNTVIFWYLQYNMELEEGGGGIVKGYIKSQLKEMYILNHLLQCFYCKTSFSTIHNTVQYKSKLQ